MIRLIRIAKNRVGFIRESVVLVRDGEAARWGGAQKIGANDVGRVTRRDTASKQSRID
jgi:hypothetical protein